MIELLKKLKEHKIEMAIVNSGDFDGFIVKFYKYKSHECFATRGRRVIITYKEIEDSVLSFEEMLNAQLNIFLGDLSREAIDGMAKLCDDNKED